MRLTRWVWPAQWAYYAAGAYVGVVVSMKAAYWIGGTGSPDEGVLSALFFVTLIIVAVLSPVSIIYVIVALLAPISRRRRIVAATINLSHPTLLAIFLYASFYPKSVCQLVWFVDCGA